MKKFKRNPNTIFKVSDNTVYILDPNDNTLHTLNETASYIWETLNKPQTEAEICKKLIDTFEISVDEAKKDVAQFLQHLQSRKFVI